MYGLVLILIIFTQPQDISNSCSLFCIPVYIPQLQIPMYSCYRKVLYCHFTFQWSVNWTGSFFWRFSKYYSLMREFRFTGSYSVYLIDDFLQKYLYMYTCTPEMPDTCTCSYCLCTCEFHRKSPHTIQMDTCGYHYIQCAVITDECMHDWRGHFKHLILCDFSDD